MERQAGKVALITGANKGIGFEIARGLGQAGTILLVGARDPVRGEEAARALRGAGFDAAFVRLDVTDAASVHAAAGAVEAAHGRLDILVNNAGINDPADGPPDRATADGAKRVFETNFFGALAVTQAMLPLLLRSAAGRIVNVSSSLGSMAVNGDPSSPYYAARLICYNASKAALNMLTVQLAEMLKDTPIAANAACPGYVATDLNGHTGYLTPREGAATPVRLALLPDKSVNGRFMDARGEVPW